MKAFDTTAIRNVAIAGHSGSGKTSLGDALLYTAGASSRLGKVQDGSSVQLVGGTKAANARM